MSDVMLEVRKLEKHYPLRPSMFRSTKGKVVHAVDGVSFVVRRGETLALVGESGCGKTTLALTILKLLNPTAGEVFFEGRDISKSSKKEIFKFRRQAQIIFQDPLSSLNPRMTVADIVGESFAIHHHVERNKRKERILWLLNKVGLADYHLFRYPHEFSGGQRQRVAIARSLAVEPKLLIADEPVSSIDVSVRAQILNLLADLKKEFGLTMLFISHDLSVVRHVADRVAVMYLGKIVELAESELLFSSPQHPYSQILISAVPIPDPEHKRNRIVLTGDVPTPINPPPGCRFNTRCPYRMPICSEVEPELRSTTSLGEHFVACHLLSPTPTENMKEERRV